MDSEYGIERAQKIRKAHKPYPTVVMVVDLCAAHWGMALVPGSAKVLDSYDDANFYVAVLNNGVKEEYLVKYYNRMEADDPELLRGLSVMLGGLHAKLGDRFKFPHAIHPLASSSADDMVRVQGCPLADGSRAEVIVRVFHWISGVAMNTVPTTEALLREVGDALGQMQMALEGVDHRAFHREQMWDLTQFPKAMPLLAFVDDHELVETIHRVQAAYAERVLACAAALPMSVIMGDCNDANVIVLPTASGHRVAGLIDFSDAVHTWSVNELAVCMAYMLLTSFALQQPMQAVAAVLQGFTAHRLLQKEEIRCLAILISARLSMSIVVGAFSIHKEPDNEYLKLHALPARRLLKTWCRHSWDQHEVFFRRCQEAFAGGAVDEQLLDDISEQVYGCKP